MDTVCDSRSAPDRWNAWLSDGEQVIPLVPEKTQVDALHIAVAAVNGMDYLLTWNCKHIANAEMQAGIGRQCRAAGFEPPVICTPEDLLGS